MAATAELTRRARGWRGVAAAGGAPEALPARDLAAAEVAAASNLSHQGALFRVDLAADLVRLSGTRLALAGGRIDRAKVLAIVDAVAVLDDGAAAAVEARVLSRAPAQTLPGLRAALRRAVIAADPAAAEKRRHRRPRPSGVVDRLRGRAAEGLRAAARRSGWWSPRAPCSGWTRSPAS